jgi:hypothetical protein
LIVALWLWIALIALLLVSRGGCTGITITSAPPYAATKPTVLIVEDESVEGRKALTGEQDDIMRSLLADGVRKSVEAVGGEIQVLGVKNTTELDSDWAKAAGPSPTKFTCHQSWPRARGRELRRSRFQRPWPKPKHSSRRSWRSSNADQQGLRQLEFPRTAG